MSDAPTVTTAPLPSTIVGVDMDGTLLDGNGRLPEHFAELVEDLGSRGVIIAPASGRQLATLRDMFGNFRAGDRPLPIIAENGTVVHDGSTVISTTPVRDDTVHRTIDAVNAHNAGLSRLSGQEQADRHLTLVVCRPECAFVDDHLARPDQDEALASEIAKYYHENAIVDDLHEIVNGDVIKLAVYSPTNAEEIAYPVAARAAEGDSVAVSGQHWVDVMNPNANKGRALLALADTFGVDPSQTLAFGDYLNDYEMLDAAGTAYAMANAHPRLKEIADHIAPANTDNGVVRVLRERFLDH